MSESLVELFMALEGKLRKTYGAKTEVEMELEELRVAVMKVGEESFPESQNFVMFSNLDDGCDQDGMLKIVKPLTKKRLSSIRENVMIIIDDEVKRVEGAMRGPEEPTEVSPEVGVPESLPLDVPAIEQDATEVPAVE